MKLVGWITAQKSDKARLRDTFSVKGKMIYNEAMGCIEYCALDSMEAVEKLRHEWPDFYAGAFTALDEDNNQLPRDEQPCWGMGGGVVDVPEKYNGTTTCRSTPTTSFPLSRWERLWLRLRPEYLWVCGPRRWMRGFYNNLGFKFDLDGSMDWSQLWPPRLWMLRNFLSNSGLTKRSQMLNRIYKYLHRRVMGELDCHS